MWPHISFYPLFCAAAADHGWEHHRTLVQDMVYIGSTEPTYDPEEKKGGHGVALGDDHVFNNDFYQIQYKLLWCELTEMSHRKLKLTCYRTHHTVPRINHFSGEAFPNLCVINLWHWVGVVMNVLALPIQHLFPKRNAWVIHQTGWERRWMCLMYTIFHTWNEGQY